MTALDFGLILLAASAALSSAAFVFAVVGWGRALESARRCLDGWGDTRRQLAIAADAFDVLYRTATPEARAEADALVWAAANEDDRERVTRRRAERRAALAQLAPHTEGADHAD